MRIWKGFVSLMTICLLSCFVFTFYEIKALAYVTVGAEIPVTCLKISDDKTHIYEIVIKSENDISPKPKSDMLEITEDGSGKFEIDIDEPGTFNYIIYEKSGDDPNIKYDTNIYNVTVFVEDISDGSLQYAVSATIVGKDKKPDKIEFQDAVLVETDVVTAATTTLVTTVPTTTAAVPDETVTTTTVTAAAVTTTVPTETTAAVTTTKSNPVKRIVTTVMTGDTMPMRTLRITMLSAMVILILTFFTKQRKEDDENDNKE